MLIRLATGRFDGFWADGKFFGDCYGLPTKVFVRSLKDLADVLNNYTLGLTMDSSSY